VTILLPRLLHIGLKSLRDVLLHVLHDGLHLHQGLALRLLRRVDDALGDLVGALAERRVRYFYRGRLALAVVDDLDLAAERRALDAGLLHLLGHLLAELHGELHLLLRDVPQAGHGHGLAALPRRRRRGRVLLGRRAAEQVSLCWCARDARRRRSQRHGARREYCER
ncbi:unnamed protein product, partial [Pelagomonas calceolata]